jgi:hypothetical protein
MCKGSSTIERALKAFAQDSSPLAREAGVDRSRIVQILDAAEDALAEGRGVQGTGFWQAVNAARVDPTVAAEFGDRIAATDTKAFEEGVRLRVPAGLGTAVLAGGAGAGVVALLVASGIQSRFLRTLFFLGAFGLLELTTHSLAHLIVGRMMGMRFTHYFLGGPPPPRPGAKVDYSTYLKVPPARRALMHASGAVVTKAIPFALIPVGVRLDLPKWAIYLLVAVGILQVVTDVLFSTKTSDWKKVKRELQAARKQPT